MSLHAYHGPEPHPIADLDMLITGGCGQGFRNPMQRMAVRLLVTGETDPLSAVQVLAEDRPQPPPAPGDHRH